MPPVWSTPNHFAYFFQSNLSKILLKIWSPYLKAIDWPSNNHRKKFKPNCVKHRPFTIWILYFWFHLLPFNPYFTGMKLPAVLWTYWTLCCYDSVPLYVQVSPWHEYLSLHSLVNFHSICKDPTQISLFSITLLSSNTSIIILITLYWNYFFTSLSPLLDYMLW